MGLRDLFRRRRNTTVPRSTPRGRFTRLTRFEPLEQRTLLAVWPGTDPALWNDIDPNLLPNDDDPLFSIGDDLAAYYRGYDAWDGRGEFAPTDSRVRTDNGLVSLRLMVGGDGGDVVEAVEALGMKVVETDAGKLTGWIPTDKLDDLAAVEGINTAWPVRLDPIVGDGGSSLASSSSDVIPPMNDYSYIGVLVGFRTDAMIEDIGAYVESLDWPAEIGVIQPDSVKQLLSFPWMQEDGTFQTITRFEVITSVGADVSQNLIDTLEGLEFISYAKLESERSRVFSDQLQKSVNAITTGAAPGWFYASGNEFSPVQDPPSDPIDEIDIQVTLPGGSLEPTIITDPGEQTGGVDFYAAGAEGALWNAGSYNVAKSFDQVHAFSDNGAEMGWLDGTGDDDLFYGNSTVARMWATGW